MCVGGGGGGDEKGYPTERQVLWMCVLCIVW